MSRKIDALIAEHIMGWKTGPYVSPYKDLMFPPGAGKTEAVPHYSTDIAAAWLVVEKLAPTFFYKLHNYVGDKWESGSDAYYFVLMNASGRFLAREKTAPMAICLAALKAEGVEVSDDQD